jgi:hypothetical protein
MGLFDGYFGRPGSGILGSRFDDADGAWPENGPQATSAAVYPWSAATAASGAVNPSAISQLVTALGLNVPSAAVQASPPAAPLPADLPAGKGTFDPTSGNDFLSRLGQGLRDNSSMLMAMGGGMMTGGLGRGFQAGAEAAAGADRQAAQAPQIIKVRRPEGGEALMAWDASQRRYVPAPMAGTGAWPGMSPPQPTARMANSPPQSVPASVTPSGPQEGATATNPSTGERLIFRNGQWQPTM